MVYGFSTTEVLLQVLSLRRLYSLVLFLFRRFLAVGPLGGGLRVYRGSLVVRQTFVRLGSGFVYCSSGGLFRLV